MKKNYNPPTRWRSLPVRSTRFIKSLWLLSVLFLTTTVALQSQNIHCIGPFGGAGGLGEPGLWTLIGQPGNSDDFTGYGGVNYAYSYLDRFIRIGDYLDFLNSVDPSNTGNYEGELVNLGLIQYSGGTWSARNWTECSGSTGQSMTAAQVEQIAVSYISFNQAARFANWVNDGNVNTGAYTFASSNGNANVTSVNLNCDCIRLPTEDEFYKAAYYNPSSGTYSEYGTTSLSGGVPRESTVSASGVYNTSNGHAYNLSAAGLFNGPGGLHCLWQIRSGQGGESAYGLYNMVGGFHHYLSNGSSSSSMVLRPQNQVQGGAAEQSRNWRDASLSRSTFYASPSFHLVIVGDQCGGISCTDPVINAISNQTICLGGAFSTVSTAVTNGVTVTWQWYNNNGTNNPTTTAITGQTSNTLTALPTATGVYSYRVRATDVDGSTCFADRTVTLTISNPTVNAVTSQTVCAGNSTTAISFAGTATQYRWTNDNTSIGLAASGTGNITAFTAANSGTTNQVATITVTPRSAGPDGTLGTADDCLGTARSFTITVTPRPTATTASAVGTCSGTTAQNNATITLSSITTADRIGISTANAASYNGPAYASATAIVGASHVFTGLTHNATYRIRVYNGATNCTTDYTVATPFLDCSCTTPTLAAISNQSICQGGTFGTVSTSVTNGVGVTWQWYNNNGAANPTTTAIAGQMSNTFTAVPSAPGVYAYRVRATNATEPSCFADATVTLTVFATPTVNDPTDQTVCANNSATAVTFTGTGTQYRWTNDNTSIGLAASGTGNIAAFTAVNGGTTNQVATITVTPRLAGPDGSFGTADDCIGSPQTFTITVTPRPAATTGAATGSCSGIVSANDATITLSSITAGNRIGISTAGAASYNGPAYAAATTIVGASHVFTGLTHNATYRIRVYNGADGCSTDYVVATPFLDCSCTNPILNPITNQTICQGGTFGTVSTSVTNGVGVTWQWYNNNGAANPTTTAIAGQMSNTLTALPTLAGVYVYRVRATNATESSCFDDETVTLTILPLPTANDPANQAVCAGNSTTAVTFTGTGVQFTWVNDNTSIGLAASGTGNIAAFTATNTTGSDAVANITVTPRSVGPDGIIGNVDDCIGSTQTFTITVNPTPDLPAGPLSLTNVCPAMTGDLTSLVPVADARGTTGAFTYHSTLAGASNPANNTTAVIPNPTTVAIPGTYYIRKTTSAGCFDYVAVNVTMVSCYSIGSTVFKDYNDNGVQDATEAGIANVPVQLWQVVGTKDPTPGSIDDVQIGATLQTNASGNYYFPDLGVGYFYVVIPNTAFGAGAALNQTKVSSTARPATNVDNEIDGDDNGTQMSGPGTMVMSAVIQLGEPGGEPTGAAEGFQGGTQDDSADSFGDMTVDFGFFTPIALCSDIYADLNNNGTRDGTEMGVAGVVMNVYTLGANGIQEFGAGDDEFKGTATSIGDGSVSVGDLKPGTYYTSLDYRATIYLRYLPANENRPDWTASTTMPGVYYSLVETYESTDNENECNIGRSSMGRPRLGLFFPVGLGSTVFQDLNNNAMQDASEMGLADVELLIYQVVGNKDGDGNVETDDVLQDVGSDGYLLSATDGLNHTTDANGDYLFTGLDAGRSYYVVIPATQFAASAALENFNASSTDIATTNGDNRTDSDDNGIQMGGMGTMVMSPAITLISDNEPLNDVETGQAGDIDDTDDNDGDMTVDFGFYAPVAVCTEVFVDVDNDGVRDLGENGIPGITMNVYTLGTNGIKDNGGGDDALAATGMSDGTGMFVIPDLMPGQYYMEMDFTTTPYVDYLSAIPNRVEWTASAVTGIYHSNVHTATSTGIRNACNAAFNNIRLGMFFPVSLGSTVFEDRNNNAMQDLGEAGIANVELLLYEVVGNKDGDGNIETDDLLIDVGSDGDFLTTTDALNHQTNPSGNYLFQGLNSGRLYYVVIAPNQFTVGNPLNVLNISSTNIVTSISDNRIDGDDNGTQVGGAGGRVTSPVISLMTDQEPLNDIEVAQGYNQDDADENDGDMTVDFGFYAPVTVGDFTWVDVDDNGQQDANPALAGVQVTLYNALTNSPVTMDVYGAPVLPQLTNATGNYLFENLPVGSYYAVFDKDNGSVVNPDFYEFTSHNTGSDATDSDANVTTGVSDDTPFLFSGEEDRTLDAGFLCTVDVNAGSDQDLCSTQLLDLTAMGANVMPTTIVGFAGTWTSTGTGDFLNAGATVVSPARFGVAVAYRPSVADIAAGQVILTLTTDNPASFGSACPVASDQVTITILKVNCGAFPWDGN